jgi:OmpA-OmpF porin, OOP family
MPLRVLHFSMLALLLMLTGPVHAGDVPKSEDHPLIKRYEGSTIVRYSQKAFDEYALTVGPVVGRGNEAHFPKALKLEGRVTRITYLVPAGRSTLEVVRNYEMELKQAGFTTLFAGAHEALGQGKFDSTFASAGYRDIEMPSFSGTNFSMLVSKDDRFLAAKLARPQGDVHVALYAATIAETWGKFLYADPPNRNKTAADGQVIAQLDIVEAKPMETNMVTVSAGAMASGIAATGSVALYGILFDTNSAVVKSESMPTLEEIAKLLKEQPALRLLVVGHTDNVGTFQFNVDLSQRRAASVVQTLASKFEVDPKRLTPVGVSFASPVASNKTEEGRAKNRRVQLVENDSSSPGR